MDLQKLLKEYFENNTLMQLATVKNGQPWLCNLYYVTDEDNKIYWTSARKQRHSKEIISDSNAAVTIVQDAVNKQALQITGKAYEVPLDDVKRVDGLYAAKFGYKDRLTQVMVDSPESRAYWVFEPELISFFDEVNFPDAPKQELIV